MGYALTTIVAYGIKIDEETAQKIFENEFDEESGDFEDVSLYQNMHFRKNYDKNSQEQPVTPYEGHSSGVGSTVFHPKMWADDTDSRIQSLTFEEGCQHYLGIYIASNGYGYNDNLKDFKKTPKEAIENFETGIRPLMEKYGIKGRPGIRMIKQVW